jgi:hypothetical protein
LFVHGNDPTDQQRQASRNPERPDEYSRAGGALFEYYTGWLFRLFAGLPRLKEPDAIWEMVVDPMVSVLRGKGQAPPRITISWECAWGDDGVEVILEGGKAVYTGNDYGE